MNQQTKYAILFLGIFLLLVLVSHILYRYFNWPSERSRKFLHVAGGILSLFCPLVFQSHWWVFVLCSLAFLLLFITYLQHLLPAIHQTKRKSVGSVIFPVSVYICFLTAKQSGDNVLFYLPVSFLTISDTVAEWSGKRWGNRFVQFRFNEKTLAGSVAFLLSSLIIAFFCGWQAGWNVDDVVVIGCCLSVIGMITEMISTRGLDNITVPLVTLLFLMWLKQMALQPL